MNKTVTSSKKYTIRSFVLRQGHLTNAQQQAIDALWPQFGIDYQETPLNLTNIFGRDNQKILEIGFGMGNATAEIAIKLPEKDFLAIEVHSPGVGNLLKLIQEHQIHNIRIIRHDAVEVIENMIADNTLDGVHIFFPDPWHKKRHHKRRLIQTNFLNQLMPKLKTGGYIHLATDWEDYAIHMLDTLSSHPNLHNTVQNYAPKPEYRPETKFELRGKKLGHSIWDLIFTKK